MSTLLSRALPRTARRRAASARPATALLALALFTAPALAFDHSERHVAVGDYLDLGSRSSGDVVIIPGPWDWAPIVGMAVDKDENVYVWRADGTVSWGTPTNLHAGSIPVPYRLPKSKSPWDIIAVAIGAKDQVYAYYADGKYSIGTSEDLRAHQGPQDFSIPAGMEIGDIAGIAADSKGNVYGYYSNRTVSVGIANKLDHHDSPKSIALPKKVKIGHVLGIGKWGDSVFTWSQDLERGKGHRKLRHDVDVRVMDTMQRYELPGVSVAVSKAGRLVLEKGYGYRLFETGGRMNRTTRGRCGSVSKVITALSAMHLVEAGVLHPKHRVYDPAILGTPQNLERQAQGIGRHHPIVGKAADGSDTVWTWDHNGNVAAGTSTNPDLYAGPDPYVIPDDLTPEDIVGMAIRSGATDEVFTWYYDGTISVGDPWDLASIVPRDEEYTARPLAGYSLSNIVGFAYTTGFAVVTFYDSGVYSVGNSEDLGAGGWNTYTAGLGPMGSWDIRETFVSKQTGSFYAYFRDGTVIHGTRDDLDEHGGPVDYAVRDYSYNYHRDWEWWYEDMLIDQLLSHTSGFERSGDVPGTVAMFGGPEEDLDYSQVHEHMLATRRLLEIPSLQESYSNHGMGLVGHIVAELSGDSFEDYARTHVVDFLELDMDPVSQGQRGRDMWRHAYDEDGIPYGFQDDPAHNLGLAAGGWKSSAGDLVRLMLGTDQNPTHPDVLLGPTLDLMESRPYPWADRAHGWDKTDQGKLMHSGATSGGNAYIAKYPVGYFSLGSDEVTVAVLTNVDIDDEHGGTDALVELAGSIAVAADRASIGAGYDLY